MLRSLFVLLSYVVIISCAHNISGDNSAYAPSKNEKSGIVAYNPAGLKKIVEIRRNSALEMIYEACGGSNNYSIIKEEEKLVDREPINNFDTLGAKKLHYLHYKCKD